MLLDLGSWQAVCVQVIRREGERLGFLIHDVYKASTGTWYVRLRHTFGGPLAVVRLSDHRSRAIGGSVRVLSIVQARTGRLLQLRAFLSRCVPLRP